MIDLEFGLYKKDTPHLIYQSFSKVGNLKKTN
jgi:hypothetical protein